MKERKTRCWIYLGGRSSHWKCTKWTTSPKQGIYQTKSIQSEGFTKGWLVRELYFNTVQGKH